jgi:hypothetical protein
VHQLLSRMKPQRSPSVVRFVDPLAAEARDLLTAAHHASVRRTEDDALGVADALDLAERAKIVLPEIGAPHRAVLAADPADAVGSHGDARERLHVHEVHLPAPACERSRLRQPRIGREALGPIRGAREPEGENEHERRDGKNQTALRRAPLANELDGAPEREEKRRGTDGDGDELHEALDQPIDVGAAP